MHGLLRLALPCLAALLLIPGAPVVAADKNLVEARKLGAALALRKMTHAGTGLLVVQARLTDKSRFSKEPLEAFELEFAQALGGIGGRVEVRPGATAIATLPAGRHCVSAVYRSGKRFKAKCEPPYFDVSADSVDATGIVDIEIRRSKAEVTARDIENFHRDVGLSAEQHAQVNEYLAAAASRGTRTFFVSSPPGLKTIVRLRAGGEAEEQKQALANAAYTRGEWSDNAGLKLTYYEGNNVQWFEPAGESWFGFESHRSQASPDPIATFQVRHFAVATDIRCWHWSLCGQRYRSSLVMTPDFSWVGDVSRLDGNIEVEFGVDVREGVAFPRDVAPVGGTLSGAIVGDVVEQFADAQFMANAIPPSANARFRMTIAFKVEADELDVEYGTVRPATP